jgi:hypothetical protein
MALPKERIGRSLTEFLKTTLIGGLLFLLPAVLIVIKRPCVRPSFELNDDILGLSIERERASIEVVERDRRSRGF